MGLNAPQSLEYTAEVRNVYQPPQQRIERQIDTSTDALTAEIAKAIIQSESAYENVVGVTGDMGIMQFSPITWEDVCLGDAMNIEDNVKCGLYLLEDKQFWRWRASMYDRGEYKGWLNQLSTTTKQYVKNLCECVTYVRNDGLDLPRVETASELIHNSPPFVGAGFLLENHIGRVTKMNEEGFIGKNGNCYNRCEICEKFYPWDLKGLRGFISS